MNTIRLTLDDLQPIRGATSRASFSKTVTFAHQFPEDERPELQRYGDRFHALAVSISWSARIDSWGKDQDFMDGVEAEWRHTLSIRAIILTATGRESKARRPESWQPTAGEPWPEWAAALIELTRPTTKFVVYEVES